MEFAAADLCHYDDSLHPSLDRPVTQEDTFHYRKETTMVNSTGNTGTRDKTYDLVSILYHALQGAETDDRYIQDAEQNGDQELAQFLRDVKNQNRQLADRAKQLLAARLKQG
jgi:hypothetical protein